MLARQLFSTTTPRLSLSSRQLFTFTTPQPSLSSLTLKLIARVTALL
jgi:hypothetical protein